ncbi:hypothetical protein PG995_013628 [Apiospora arundinis]
MSLYRVIGGACALASLVSSAMGDDTPRNSGVKPTELISIPLRRVQGSAGGSTSVQRRYFKSNVLGIYGAAYLAELSVGTSAQPQKVDVLLDTGSFELWVNPDCAKSNEPNFCQTFGQYDPNKSSTAKSLGQPYKIQYGSGSTSGTYYTDDINFSGAKITGQQFGVANTSDAVWFGIMGLAQGRGNGFINYNTIVDSVVAQGYANSRLFSMDLGSQGQPAGLTSGQIVFGGVDTSKYAGYLVKMPIDPNNPHYTIRLNQLTHRPPGATDDSPVVNLPSPIRLIVDSGTTLSLLPRNMVDALAAQFPGATTDGRGGYRVPCSYQQQSGAVVFALSSTSYGGESLPPGARISVNVPYSEFIWNAGGNVCYLGAWSDDSVGVYILGDTFLRSAYVVFDQDSKAMFMGDYSRCIGPGAAGSNLVSVPAGRYAVGNIPGTCAQAPFPGSGGGSSAAAGPASSTTGGDPSVTLAGGPLPSSSLGGSAGPTINPVAPVSVSSSAPAAADPSSSAAPVPSSTATAGATTTPLGTSPGTSSPPVAAPPTSTPFNGPALDPNAVPAGGSGNSGAASAGPTITGGSGNGSGNGDGNGNGIGNGNANGSGSGSGSGSGNGGSSSGGNDPNVNPNLAPGAGAAATAGTVSGIITSTITNLIVYTVTACPPSAGTACVTGQLATRTSVYVTTICPTATPVPGPAIGEPSPQRLPRAALGSWSP